MHIREAFRFVFQGSDGYVSASWYRDDTIPTWNHVTLHVRGTPEPFDDALPVLRRTVDHFEAAVEHRRGDAPVRDLRLSRDAAAARAARRTGRSSPLPQVPVASINRSAEQQAISTRAETIDSSGNSDGRRRSSVTKERPIT